MLCYGTGVFKTYASFRPLCAIIGNTKIEIFEVFLEIPKKQYDFAQY